MEAAQCGAHAEEVEQALLCITCLTLFSSQGMLGRWLLLSTGHNSLAPVLSCNAGAAAVLEKYVAFLGAGLRWQHTLARMKQASLGEQGCSLSHKATFHIREVSTQVTPKEQRTDKTYQNCFLPLAKQKLSKDTMTCRTQALKIRHYVGSFCSELSYLFVVLTGTSRSSMCSKGMLKQRQHPYLRCPDCADKPHLLKQLLSSDSSVRKVLRPVQHSVIHTAGPDSRDSGEKGSLVNNNPGCQ